MKENAKDSTFFTALQSFRSPWNNIQLQFKMCKLSSIYYRPFQTKTIFFCILSDFHAEHLHICIKAIPQNAENATDSISVFNLKYFVQKIMFLATKILYSRHITFNFYSQKYNKLWSMEHQLCNYINLESVFSLKIEHFVWVYLKKSLFLGFVIQNLKKIEDWPC